MISTVSWRASGWWLTLAALSPLVLAQALWARRVALRLPEAVPPATGFLPGQGEALRVAVVGESTAAGVGVRSHAAGLAGQLGEQLARATGRPVRWHAIGANGYDAAQTRASLLPRTIVLRPDLIVVVLGVNDTTGLTRLGRWRTEITGMIREGSLGGARLVFSGVPPMHLFPALPRPLRWILGVRARLLGAILREICREQGVLHVDSRFEARRELMAADGYHPSALGYTDWAALLVGALTREAGPHISCERAAG